MLTDEDIKKIAILLEEYGLKKQPTKGALRTRRYRQKKGASQNVTATSQTVTEQGLERHKTSHAVTKRHNGHPKDPAPTKATWAAYSAAYQDRYHAPPKWNGSVGGMLKTFIGKLGAEEAPHVAAFYIWHNGHYYVREMHPIRIMVRDAEKLRTEWATRTTVTDTQARQADRTQTNLNVWGKLIEEAQANEGNKDPH